MQQPLPINPGATLDVCWDWTKWLAGDSIVSASVTSSIGLALSSITTAAGKVTAWATPIGTPPDGTVFFATCRITTASTPPRVDSRDIEFIVARQ
jgi:hypothetical protein